MNNLECPACKQNIDGDSLYCDQCGAQILICSVCGRAGKGKRCIFDGKEMIAPGGQASATEHVAQAPISPAPAQAQPAQVQPAQPVVQSQPVQSQAAQIQQASPVSVQAAEKIKLTAQTHGIAIETSENAVLGRTKGTYAAVLGRFSHISGTHCQLTKANGAWSIMDLGSTNGTFVNGAKLNPNAAVPLTNGAKVKLADIEFLISMEAAEGGTQRI